MLTALLVFNGLTWTALAGVWGFNAGLEKDKTFVAGVGCGISVFGSAVGIVNFVAAVMVNN